MSFGTLPKSLQRINTVVILLLLPFYLSAQSPVGVWKTIDDESGLAKSHVQIYEKNGKLFGKIVKLLNVESTICDKCSGDRKNAPLVGMEIMRDMSKNGDLWKGGRIFDPKKDYEYKCKIWLEDEEGTTLSVRGFWLGFYRTQTWYRVD